MGSFFIGGGDDLRNRRSPGGRSCPLCGGMMSADGPMLSCENGHAEIAFSSFSGEFITASEAAAKACQARGHSIERAANHFVIHP